MRGHVVATGAALCVLAAGCSTDQPADPESGGSGDPAVSTAPSGTPEETTGPSDVASGTTPPGSSNATPSSASVDLGSLDGPLGEQTRWVMAQLVPGASGPAATEVEERFHPDFLAEVPPDQLVPVLAQFRDGPALTPTAVTPVDEGPDGVRSTRLTLSGEEPLRMTIAVDADGLITGLLFQPGPPADLPEFASWEELAEEFAALGGTTRLYVGDVADGRCTTAYGAGQEAAPAGSVFKLIVLSAVVDAVAAGDLAWEDELTLTAELKSLPSGQLQDRSDGELVPVGEAAELMIAISDNTATDLLMDAVGPDRLREAVERATDDPDRLTPLLTTRAYFQLGWDASELREQWAEADPQRRRAILDELPDDLTRLRGNPFALNEPAWPDGVGWFLTGEEICTAHAVLQEQARTEAGAPVRQILSANPGLPAPEAATYQGFKGGSSVGVLAYTFYVETGGDTGADTTDETGAGTADDTGASTSAPTGRVLSVQVSHDGQILPTAYTTLTQAALAHLVRPDGG